MVPSLGGVDPDDAFSSVPYEKGHSFLFYLEHILGGPSVFEPFLRSYVQHFASKALTTDQWKDYLYQYIREHHPEKVTILDQVDWNAWLYSPGMPPVDVSKLFDTELADECVELAKR